MCSSFFCPAKSNILWQFFFVFYCSVTWLTGCISVYKLVTLCSFCGSRSQFCFPFSIYTVSKCLVLRSVAQIQYGFHKGREQSIQRLYTCKLMWIEICWDFPPVDSSCWSMMYNIMKKKMVKNLPCFSSKNYIFEFSILLVLLESCGYVAKMIQTQMVRTTSPLAVIALSLLFFACIYIIFVYAIIFLLLFLSFASPARYYGHLYWWPWYMTWAFVYNLFCLLDILLCCIYFC